MESKAIIREKIKNAQDYIKSIMPLNDSFDRLLNYAISDLNTALFVLEMIQPALETTEAE